ncbi:serine protease [Enterovibrio norvegicus]|uniref:serine protease n=1 Tax=Enterovibrio norvegicus TaxID=188144 RepID=UPI00354B4820
MAEYKPFVALIALISAFIPKGIEANEISPRVVGGQDATISEVPWQAYINSAGDACGGVVIDDVWILTAAHCLDTNNSNRDGQLSVVSATNVSVYTGTAEILGIDFSIFRSEVEAVYVHGNYDKQTLENDIALIKLSTSVNANASAIALASAEVQARVDATGNLGLNDLTLSGWGFINTGASVTTSTLQTASISTISDSTCATDWGVTVTGVSDYRNKFFCAEATNIGSCNGDSGGPLAWKDANTGGGDVLVGVVSFGPASQCASNAFPDVYTQVSNYVDWINDCKAGNCMSVSSSIALSGGGGGNALYLWLLGCVSILLRQRIKNT